MQHMRLHEMVPCVYVCRVCTCVYVCLVCTCDTSMEITSVVNLLAGSREFQIVGAPLCSVRVLHQAGWRHK